MKHSNRLVGVLGFSLAIVGILLTSQVPLFIRGLPGPALFPLFSLVLMMISSIVLFFKEQEVVDPESKEDTTIIISKRFIFSILGLVIYFILLQLIGFFVSTSLAIIALFSFLKRMKLYYSTIFAIIVVGFIYCIFTLVLNVNMNWGLLF